MTELLRIAPEVAVALDQGRPVVALETTIVAHGFPPGEGLAVGEECEERVRETGGVPATVAVVDGALRIGLSGEELERIAAAGPAARKVGARDLATCILSGELGATTVGGTLAACRRTGIRFAATGGIGGVHRAFASRPDVSSDITELARTQALVVCSGAKSLLDVTATAELLETLSVPMLGFRTDELPRFYAATGGPAVSARVESAEEAARVLSMHWRLGAGNGVVLARPPSPALDDLDPLLNEALREAETQGISGQQVTPFVLGLLHERSGGRTLEVNRQLAADNAGLAAEVAVAYFALSRATWS